MTTEDRAAADSSSLAALVRRHLRYGWATVCAFVVFGLVLDGLHAFKVGLYLDVGTETRRLMWTLAHAHGLGLAILHLLLAGTLRTGALTVATVRLARASAWLVWAGVLIPVGFFLGGLAPQGSDPAIGVFLVPIGGLALLASVISVTLEVFRA